MILAQGGRLALAGVILARSRPLVWLDSLLYVVSGLDLAAYGAAAGVLLLVALGANLVPLLRLRASTRSGRCATSELVASSGPAPAMSSASRSACIGTARRGSWPSLEV